MYVICIMYKVAVPGFYLGRVTRRATIIKSGLAKIRFQFCTKKTKKKKSLLLVNYYIFYLMKKSHSNFALTYLF